MLCLLPLVASGLLAEDFQEAIASVQAFYHEGSACLELGNEINLEPNVLLQKIKSEHK